MKVFIVIGLIAVFTAIIWGQVKVSNQVGSISGIKSEKIVDNKNQQRCTSAVDGLIFCISSPSVSVRMGQSVPIVFSIYNSSKKTISLSEDYFDNVYSSTVVDSKGEKVLSIKEVREKKSQITHEVTEDMITAVPINPPFSSISILPGKKIETTFNLGYFYDFKTKGKYKILIRKKATKPNTPLYKKFLLGTIEVEIN